MKQITSYIREGLRINKNTKVDQSGLIIEYEGEEYCHSIGDNLPIDDYAESAQEALEMIKRDTSEKDKLYILKKLDNGHYKPIYKDLDGYFTKDMNCNYSITCHKFHNTHNKSTIETIYIHGCIIVKING